MEQAYQTRLVKSLIPLTREAASRPLGLAAADNSSTRRQARAALIARLSAGILPTLAGPAIAAPGTQAAALAQAQEVVSSHAQVRMHIMLETS